jgi:hypothetical protein
MADEKKRGFHALEKRIHEMEEEDQGRTPEKKAAESKEARQLEKKEPPKK